MASDTWQDLANVATFAGGFSIAGVVIGRGVQWVTRPYEQKELSRVFQRAFRITELSRKERFLYMWAGVRAKVANGRVAEQHEGQNGLCRYCSEDATYRARDVYERLQVEGQWMHRHVVFSE